MTLVASPAALAATPGTDSRLAEIVAAHPQANTLVVASAFWPALLGLKGRLVFLGPGIACPPEPPPSFSFLHCPDQDSILRMLAQLADEHPAPAELVLVDHDHSGPALLAQIRALMPLARPDALWAFDDACPPDPAFATARPGTGWWTGQVYALPGLLRPTVPGAQAALLDSPPTGLALFRGHAPTPDAEAMLATLPEAPTATDLDAWRAGLDAAAWPAILATQAARLRPRLSLDLSGNGGREVLETLDPELPRPRAAPVAVIQARQGAPLDAGLLHDTAPQPLGSELAVLRDVTLFGFDAFFHHRELHARFTGMRPNVAWRLVAEGAWYRTMARPVLLDGEGMHLDPAALEPLHRVDEPVLFGTPDEGGNWGMWLLSASVSAAAFHRHRRRFRRLMCWAELDWQRAFLDAMGIGPAEHEPHPARLTCAVREMGLVQHSTRALMVLPSTRAALDGLMARHGVLRRPATGRRIFVSRLGRTRAGAYRGLLNEAPLLDAMRARGFDIVEPETMPLPAQMALFRDAACVAGLGGAGMFNTVFCRPGTPVITIESGTEFIRAHAGLFSSCELPYGVVFGEEDPTDPSPAQRRWSLDLPVALEGIDAMLAGWGLGPRVRAASRPG